MQQQQNKKRYTLYPPNATYVRKDKDLILYNVFYHSEIDTLFITYKNVVTGEQIFDSFEEPLIPIFIANIKMNRMEQLYPIDNCTRHLVRYNKKYQHDDIKSLLYDYKEIKYQDQYGVTRYKRIYKDIPKGGFSLNPNLFGYGDSIEQIILKEFALQRFEEHDGFASEVLPPVKYNIASFDIETIQEDDTTKININTFVDRKTNTAYAIYVKDFNKYPYQDTIMLDVEKFKEETRNKMLEEIDNLSLETDAGTIEKVKSTCKKIVEEMTFKVIEVESEEELIKVSNKIMFEVHSPDVLIAFNTPYDLTHFQKRIEELGLPVGLLNDKKYIHTNPRFMNGMDKRTWTMFGDTRTSKKRSCSFDVIRPTKVCDYQMIHYSNRSFNTFNSESLQNTATRNLGFGKLDFSKYSNSVVTLPYKNFRIHLSYALIDSVLLILLNEILHDIESKLAYCLITKNNIEMSVHSNPSISNWIFCTCVYKGKIPGVNKNKLIKKLTIDELEQMSQITGIDFIAYRNNIPSKWLSADSDEEDEEIELNLEDEDTDVEYIDTDIRIRGGIVSPPQNYLAVFGDFETFNILNNEVDLKLFLKVRNDAYLDFKSHYPISFIARNLFMECINAEIVTLQKLNGEIIYSKNLHKTNKKYVDNFGFLHMPIVNDDIVTFASRACGTPTMTEMIEKFMNLDSEPNFSIKRDFEYKSEIKDKKYDKFFSLMSTIDQSKFTDTETNFFLPTNKMFLGTSSSIRYYGTRIDYNYRNKDLMEILSSESVIEGYKNPEHKTILLTRLKGELIHNPSLVPKDLKSIPEDEKKRINECSWYVMDINETTHISEIDFTSKYVKLKHLPFLLLVTSNIFYFPFKYYINNFSSSKSKKQTPIVSDIKYRYLKRDLTALVQFKYTIEYNDIDLEIVQTMNVCTHINL